VFSGKRTIVFENAFQDVSTFYQGKIVIEKEGFENIEFVEAEYTDGFVIQTYTDNSLDYIIDQLSDVKPELECGYACKSCNRTQDKNYCLSCHADFKLDTLQEGKC